MISDENRKETVGGYIKELEERIKNRKDPVVPPQPEYGMTPSRILNHKFEVPPESQKAEYGNLDEDLMIHVELGQNYLITGPMGSGKTYAMGAYAKQIANQPYIPRMGKWVFWPALILKIRSLFSKETNETPYDLTRELVQYKYLFIDDFLAEQSTEYSIDIAHLVLDERKQQGHTTIITTNLKGKELFEMAPRIASRLGGYKILKVEGKDRRIE